MPEQQDKPFGFIPKEFEPLVSMALLNIAKQGGIVAGAAQIAGGNPVVINPELFEFSEQIEQEFRQFMSQHGYDPDTGRRTRFTMSDHADLPGLDA